MNNDGNSSFLTAQVSKGYGTLSLDTGRKNYGSAVRILSEFPQAMDDLEKLGDAVRTHLRAAGFTQPPEMKIEEAGLATIDRNPLLDALIYEVMIAAKRVVGDVFELSDDLKKFTDSVNMRIETLSLTGNYVQPQAEEILETLKSATLDQRSGHMLGKRICFIEVGEKLDYLHEVLKDIRKTDPLYLAAHPDFLKPKSNLQIGEATKPAGRFARILQLAMGLLQRNNTDQENKLALPKPPPEKRQNQLRS